MTGERGSIRPLMDALTGLLSNPMVLEGLAAGISAISASRRTKSPAGSGASGDAGSILDILPGVLPLLSVLTAPSGGESTGNDEPPPDDVEANEEAAPQQVDDGGGLDALFADAAPATEEPHAEVSGVSRGAQRENLLLALRPFLSESRRSAADAMVQVNKLSGIFRQGQP